MSLETKCDSFSLLYDKGLFVFVRGCVFWKPRSLKKRAGWSLIKGLQVKVHWSWSCLIFPLIIEKEEEEERINNSSVT